MDKIFGEIEKTSRSQLIVEKFKQALAEGRLKIGDKLPPERELSASLGVSRTSLREAIQFLSAYGLLEAIQGEGTFVTDRFTSNVFEFLGFGSMLNKENFRFLLKTREVLETGCIDAAISNINQEHIKELQDLIDQLRLENENERMGQLDARFHELIITQTKNPILIQIYKMIYKMLLFGTSRVISYPNAKEIALHDHQEILNFISSKQIEKCKEAISIHLKRTEELIEEFFEV